ncbi:MAG: helix-turn-helix domain-containing protein [Novosphingobium sp.]|nr:helix-turn-helix domain-containing protein [Novosphingobium sp.]
MANEDDQHDTLPLLTAGEQLREARIAAGLDLEEIAARTRVSRRHLEAIEQSRYSQLASRTYAVGFSRSYARALGLNEDAIVRSVRDELARQEELQPRQLRGDNFEPGDPARVPSSSLAWMAGGGLILLFALLFVFWRSFLSPAGSMPDLVKEEPRAASQGTPVAKKTPAPSKPAPATGTVRLTAMEDGVWIKVTNAAGDQLFQKILALNETYTVPAGAEGAMLSTARPDILKVTVGSRVLGPLRPQMEVVRDVSLAPASLQAAPAGAPEPAVTGGGGETSTVSDR